MVRLLLLVLGACVLPATMYASIYGTLSGKVTDKDGKPVPGATVRVVGTTRGAYTKADGSYLVANITAGSYDVRFSFIGKKDQVLRATISSDQTTTLNARLADDVKGTDTVVVVANDPGKMVSKTRVGSGTELGSENIQNIPRENLQDIVTMNAGVLRDPSGGGFIIRGSRPQETQIRVDGLDIGDQFTGGLSTNMSYYPTPSNFGTEEVQVLTGGFGAQYGNAMGGIVNTVVKTGRTDRYEGNIRYRTEVEALYGSANNGIKAAARGQQSVDLNFGGPIPFLDNSTFFISSKYLTDDYRNAGIQVIDPIGNNIGKLPNNGSWVRNITGRMKFALTSEINFTVGGMYGMTNLEFSSWAWLYANSLGQAGSTLVQGTDMPEYMAKQAVQNQTVTNQFIRVNHALTNASFYDLTFSNNTNFTDVARRANSNSPGLFSGFDLVQPTDEYSNISDISKLTRPSNPDEKDRIIDAYTPLQTNDENQFYIVNPLTGYIEGDAVTGTRNPYGLRAGLFVNHGNQAGYEYRRSTYQQLDGNYTNILDIGEFRHEIKAGFEGRLFKLERNYNGQPWSGNPFYDIYTDMYGGNIFAETDQVRQETSQPYHPVTAGIYAQNQISYKGIIVTPGLRIDYLSPNSKYRAVQGQNNTFAPRSVDSLFADAPSKLQFSPRLYIAYPVTDVSVVNISYGVYYQMPQMNYMFDAFNTETIRPGASILGNPNMGPQKTNAYSIGYDLQFNQEYAMTVSAYYKDMYNIVGTTYYPSVPEPYYGYFTAEYGNSRGVELSLRKRISNHFGFNVNYTLGFARGSSSEPASNFSVGLDPTTGAPLFPLTEAYLNFDRRHSINAIVDFVWGREEGPSVAGIYPIENTSLNFTTIFQSGLPFTQRDKGGFQIGEYNGQRQPSFWRMDMRLQRRFPLQDWFGESVGRTSLDFFVDVTNLLNRTEATNLYSRTLDPDYDLATLNKERRRSDITQEITYYRADPNNAASFNPNQFDNVYGERFYNPQADLDKDGAVTPDEQYQGYLNFLDDAVARRVNYQYPRQVAVGLMINF